MTLNHSKTWPVSSWAVVDHEGRTYSHKKIPQQQYQNNKQKENNENEVVYPLSKRHLELFTKMNASSMRTTIRTDTVSTILEQDTEYDEEQGKIVLKQEDPASDLEKFHVLALTRIDENINENECHGLGRRPSNKVDNWDFIYTETKQNRCPIHRCLNDTNGDAPTKDVPEIPLDARKTTTLRRHYYLEGGWGWVVVVCSVLVHILNHGVQLSCSQLILPGAEKFKVETVHFAASYICKKSTKLKMRNSIRVTVVGDGDTGKTCILLVYRDRKFDERYIPTIFDQYSMTIPINRQEYTVILQDTAGQEEFDKLRQLAYKETDVFILCYAINDQNSWDNVKEKWAPELRRCCPRAKLILAGTKNDLEHERVLTKEAGLKLSKLIKADGFIENSAKLGRRIDETICLALTVVVNSGNKKDHSPCILL